MAVGTAKVTQGYTTTSSSSNVTWPTGAAVGELAVLVCRDGDDGRNGPKVSGSWVQPGRRLWAKIVTSADLAAPVAAWGRTFFLATLPGAAGVEAATERPSARVSAGGALFVQGWESDSASIDPTTGRLGTTWTDFTGDITACWLVPSATGGYVQLDGTEDDATYWGYAIAPIAGPAAPTLTSPESGAQVVAGVSVPLSWLHNPQVAGGVQVARKVRVKATSTGTWSYLAADGTLNAAEQVVTTASGSATITATLTAGQAYEWAVATMEGGVWSPWSPSATFTPRALPVVSAVTITATAGSLRLAVSWSVTAGYGSQTSRRVQIINAAGVSVYDSGWIASALTSMLTPAIESLVNGASYRAIVEVVQTGGLASAAVTSATPAVISVTLPAAPTSVTVADGKPLTVTVTGTPTSCGLQVERLDLGVWSLVTEVPLAAASVIIPQPLTPYGREVRYRARTWASVDGIRMYSAAWTLSALITGMDQSAYFVAADGLTYLTVQPTRAGSEEPVQGYAESVGAGATSVRVDRTPVAGVVGSGVQLYTQTAAERDAVVKWLTTSPPWWFRWPPESGLDVTPRLILTRKTPGWAHVVEVAIADRYISFDWVEQA